MQSPPSLTPIRTGAQRAFLHRQVRSRSPADPPDPPPPALDILAPAAPLLLSAGLLAVPGPRQGFPLPCSLSPWSGLTLHLLLLLAQSHRPLRPGFLGCPALSHSPVPNPRAVPVPAARSCLPRMHLRGCSEELGARHQVTDGWQTGGRGTSGLSDWLVCQGPENWGSASLLRSTSHLGPNHPGSRDGQQGWWRGPHGHVVSSDLGAASGVRSRVAPLSVPWRQLGPGCGAGLLAVSSIYRLMKRQIASDAAVLSERKQSN